MSLRIVLNLAAAVVLLSSGRTAFAQESPTKRLASIAGVAVEEYAKGVDASGRVFAQLEYEEATTFLADARLIADRVRDGRAEALGAALDAMRAAVATKVAPDSLAALHATLVAILGPDAALDLPAAPVDLEAGRELYRQRCASCHGESGRGDGFAAVGMNPPPPAFADADLMHDVTPALMYRIVTVGIQGTAMTGFSDLTPAQRWDVVTYVNTLRSDDATRARGASLLAGRCARCAAGDVPPGHTFAWLAERHDAQVLASLRAGDAALGLESHPPLGADEARAALAALRAAPVVEAAPRRTPAAIAAEVMRLLDESLVRVRAHDAAAASDLAFDAYIAFEPIEANVRTRDPGLIAVLERHFADFKGAVQHGDVAAATAVRARIDAGLPQVIALAARPATGWGAFLESLLIIVREGFEAILIIGAVVAFLAKTGNQRRVREVWTGAALGLVASAGLAVALRTALANAPASREVIEGATMLVAVAVLFSVSYWLVSKVESARWQAFIREKVGAAVSSGSTHALALVAFLAVFREGAETALFYQALLARGPQVVSPVLAGFVVGAVALGAVWVAFHRFGMRLPLRAFFATTSAMLYALAFIFIGKGLRELQEGNVLPITPLDGWPYLDVIGLYPSVETLAGQGALVVLALFAAWRLLLVRRPEASMPAVLGSEPRQAERALSAE